MTKQFWVSVAVTFVLMLGLGYLVHGFLLLGDYNSLPGMFRTQAEQQRHFPIMLAAHAIAALAFVWIYLRGKEAKPFLGQGVRYGIAMAAVMVVPKFLIYFAVEPIPHIIALKQIVLDTAAVVLMAIVVARLNK